MARSLIRPSYHQGFYNRQRGGVPLYPNLQRGIIGAWAPSLGVTGSTLFDVSGFGNDGIVSGASWNISNNNGYALTYDNAAQDEVVISNNPVLFGMSQLTIGAWVKYTGGGVTAEKNIVDAWAAGDTNYLLRWDPGPDHWEWFTDTSSGIGAGVFVTPGGTDPNSNEWIFVVATYDGANMFLYQNAIKSVSSEAQTGTIDIGSTNVLIGGQNAGTVDHWLGDIGLVFIYNRALTQNEIMQYYVDPHAAFRLRSPVSYFVPPAVGGGLLRKPLDNYMRHLLTR